MPGFLQIEIEYFLLCISTLFTLVNPLGFAPLFVILTERFSPEDRISIAKKAILTAGITLITFALLGSLIFKFYSITIEAFQIMGGIIFFRSGLKMLEAKTSRTRTTPTEQDESMDRDDIAISPIGIPMITGPGAITAAILLSGRAPGTVSYLTLFISIIIVLLLVYIIFRGGDKLALKIRQTGMRVIQRIMGIMLMVIAVQFVINGVQSVLTNIFNL